MEQTGIAWTTSGWVPWIEFFGDAKGPVPPSSNKAPYYSQTNITAATFPGTGVPNWAITTGDTISASVTWNSDPTATTSTFTFVFQDTTQNQTWTDQLTTSYIKAARGSGEWIVESPSGATKPLAAFGTTNFSGAWATAGGFTGPVTAFTNVGLAMTPNVGVGGGTTTFSGITNSASPGPLQPGAGASSSFSVTFVSADPPPGDTGDGPPPTGPFTNGLSSRGVSSAVLASFPITKIAVSDVTVASGAVFNSAAFDGPPVSPARFDLASSGRSLVR